MENKSILVFGAGKIGRSFIGQLFGLAGYEVVFSDIDPSLIAELNSRGSYPVVIKGGTEEGENGGTGEVLVIPHVRAIDGTDNEAVVREMSRASVMAVSVGKNVLGKLFPVMAAGLVQRHAVNPHRPIDLILAENMRDAASFVREGLAERLPGDFPLNDCLGLVETSIGKMVPAMTREDMEKDPLAVFAEPYNQLIVDKQGFRNAIPDVAGIFPKENIAAWVDRKAFIHNMGHATAAYFGASKHPEAKYIYEVLEDPGVYRFVRSVMLQSATVLRSAYPDDFTHEELENHTDDLLYRFRNRALKDTVFRVGQDRIRKLGPDDRFMGIIRLAQKQSMDYSLIVRAMSFAFLFKATDENGNRSPADILFDQYLEQGIPFTLEKVCGLIPEKDERLIAEITAKAGGHSIKTIQ